MDSIATPNLALYSDEALAHYGVAGMKWGVRHDRARTGSGRLGTRRQLTRAEIEVKRDKRIHRTAKVAKAAARTSLATAIGANAASATGMALLKGGTVAGATASFAAAATLVTANHLALMTLGGSGVVAAATIGASLYDNWKEKKNAELAKS